MTALQNEMTLSSAALLPPALLTALGAVLLLAAAALLLTRARGALWRIMSLALFFALLWNPVAEHALRRAVPDVAFLVVDDSASQDLPGRRAQLERIVPALQQQLKAFNDLEIRTLHVPGRDSTNLGAALTQAASEIPAERRAGAILVTDGAIHDLAEHDAALRQLGPVHALLTGDPDAFDRRLQLEEVPHFGLVGKTVKVKLRVIDEPTDKGMTTQVMLQALNGDDGVFEAQTGRSTTIELSINHAGDNIFVVTAPPRPGELTLANNRAVIRIQGIREKLRVLLVSGEPHPVERTWRNLLRADPAVELIHFTILRPPYKQDGTPQHELSLIGFPVQELFQDKLKSFDLIIFDRFRKQGMLPMPYFENIADYVEGGGAFLDASGASFVTQQSLFQTPLARILPSTPGARLRMERFVPQVTERGTQHPVTQKLGDASNWGPWYHQTESQMRQGEVLMTGTEGLPLLILDRVGKGRVAQLHSDSMWLWTHGHAGGGPATELLRRIAHWLMKEPELEEDQLQLSVSPAGEAFQIGILRPGPGPADDAATVTAPDGSSQHYPLVPRKEGAGTSLKVTQVGAYTVSRNGKDQMIVVGDPNAPEAQNLLASDKLLRPLLQATGGNAFWLAQHPDGVNIVRTDRNDRQSGNDWLGLRRNGQSVVVGGHAEELLPSWVWVLLLGATIMLGWRREGR